MIMIPNSFCCNKLPDFLTSFKGLVQKFECISHQDYIYQWHHLELKNLSHWYRSQHLVYKHKSGFLIIFIWDLQHTYPLV